MQSGIVERLQRRDEKALAIIIEQHSRFVASVIYSTANGSLTKDVIEEVTADVFVTLWDNAEKVQTDKLMGYLATIARTRTLNCLRSSASKKNNTVLCMDDYDPEDDFSIEDETEKKDIHRELHEIIRKITQPDREILIRHYYYNQTVSLISSEMCVNIETVKSKLRRTREKIKAQLIERGYVL